VIAGQWGRYAGYLCALCGIFIYGCGESDAIIRKKLNVICVSDLKAITDSLPKTGLLEKPFYSIVSYKAYKEGMYSRMAIVDFYFIKNVKVKIVRKFRYYSGVQLWDRYFNAYTFFDDTARASAR
jgi:hypothetical protein